MRKIPASCLVGWSTSCTGIAVVAGAGRTRTGLAAVFLAVLVFLVAHHGFVLVIRCAVRYVIRFGDDDVKEK